MLNFLAILIYKDPPDSDGGNNILSKAFCMSLLVFSLSRLLCSRNSKCSFSPSLIIGFSGAEKFFSAS